MIIHLFAVLKSTFTIQLSGSTNLWHRSCISYSKELKLDDSRAQGRYHLLSNVMKHAWSVVATMGCVLILGNPNQALGQQNPSGFRFDPPKVHFSIQIGADQTKTANEIVQFVSNRLTLDPKDFHQPKIALELGVRLNERTDIDFEMVFAGMGMDSEFRDWVDNDDLPIRQTTEIFKSTFGMNIKRYLRNRGQRLSQFAWIPNGWAPFVGAGGGLAVYEFGQVGDFIDFETLDVFGADLRSRGHGALGKVFAGMDFYLGAGWGLTTTWQYTWVSSPMNGDFQQFQPFDLGGLGGQFGARLFF